MLLKCAILQEPEFSNPLLESYLYKLPGVHVQGSFQDMESLEAQLQEIPADLLFLVVTQIRKEDFEFLEKLPKRPEIIIHSSNKEIAFDAYRIGAIDFLPLPLKLEDLSKAIRRVQQFIHPENANNKAGKSCFFVKSDYKIVRIGFPDILFIEGLGEYVRIHTKGKKIVTLLSLSRLEKLLPADHFFRIHRSYIIHIEKINYIQNHVVCIGQHHLSVSKSRRRELLAVINEFGLF